MPKLPRVNAREVIAVLERLSLFLARQSGSHMIHKNKSGKRVTVPFHGQRTLHPKVLSSIPHDAELTTEALIELL